MKKLSLIIFSFLAFCGASFAQVNNPGVQRSGAVTPGNVAIWQNNSRIEDGGSYIKSVSAGAGIDISCTAGNCTIAIIVPVTVARGGTNCTVASGTCLDNITAFSDTGLMRRTGAGAYSFYGLAGGLAYSGTDLTITQIGLTQLPTIANNTVLGNVSGGNSTPSALTATQLTALCNPVSATLSGCVAAYPNTTSSFLRGDGTWQTLNFAAISGQATLAQLPTMAANTALINATGSAAVPTAFALPSCAADGAHAWTYTAGVGILCTTLTTGGTVTSVGVSSTDLSVSGSPVTTAGSITLNINTAAVTNAKLSDMADSTIKGRAVSAGTGVPTDLTATQAAAIIGSVGGATKNKLVSFTRDLSTATGSQSVTGVGFTPTACLFIGGTGQIANWSMVDSSRAGRAMASIGTFATGINMSTNAIQLIENTTATNVQNASVSSWDADGFTLSWTKAGTPTGTATIYAFCTR